MNQTVKNYWIEALKSGEYQVGVNFLCAKGVDGKTYHDPLGILTDVYRKEYGGLWDNIPRSLPENWKESFYSVAYAYLPTGVDADWPNCDSYYYLTDEVELWADLDMSKQQDVCTYWEADDVTLDKLVEWIELTL